MALERASTPQQLESANEGRGGRLSTVLFHQKHVTNSEKLLIQFHERRYEKLKKKEQERLAEKAYLMKSVQFVTVIITNPMNNLYMASSDYCFNVLAEQQCTYWYQNARASH